MHRPAVRAVGYHCGSNVHVCAKTGADRNSSSCGAHSAIAPVSNGLKSVATECIRSYGTAGVEAVEILFLKDGNGQLKISNSASIYASAGGEDPWVTAAEQTCTCAPKQAQIEIHFPVAHIWPSPPCPTD